MSEKYGDLSLY